MTSRPAILLFVAISLPWLSACDRADEAPAEAAPSTDTATAALDPATGEVPAGIDATHVVDRASPADAPRTFDVKAFAGTFAGPGARLVLAADGTYTHTVHAESADADLSTAGTWTVDADGSGLLLDPDSKDEPDQRFTITSADTLTAAAGGRVLQRDGA